MESDLEGSLLLNRNCSITRADTSRCNTNKADIMELQEDAIVDIPENRVKFFGGTGKMLLPSAATVAALIKKIPEHKLITTNFLCQELTHQFEVRGTCPVTTQKALQAIAHDSSKNV